ncbi:GbsR/MarR family transcriptional regulator [Actinocorallia longicatena]|uniref:MarR family transcriptional regulator n=1 Tax=Actinocorallia longicatena TaxID=111803 RepID=A0ABP6QNK0_9ACTN
MRDEEGVRRLVEHMAMTWADLGFPKMPARVLMAMMTADSESLTAAELAERLEVSPAAISGAVRYLLQIGMLRRHPAPGSRQHAYALPEDAWYEASIMKGTAYRAIVKVTEEGMPALAPGTPSAERFAEMRDFFVFMQGEMTDLLERWHASRGAR